MFNYLLDISYDGTNYHGFAKQPKVNTIQEVIETNLSKIFNEKITIFFSGRTDRFVHALSQIINFKAKKEFNLSLLKHSLNEMFPEDIIVNKVKKVDASFNSRFSAKNKTYLYVINTKKDIFKRNYELFYSKPLDIKKLKIVSKEFLGTHNFLSFSTSEVEDTTRKINSIKISKKGSYCYIEINANGFLRSMVRMIVDCILRFNENKLKIEDIKVLLLKPKKGTAIGKAKGCGLYLKKVFY